MHRTQNIVNLIAKKTKSAKCWKSHGTSSNSLMNVVFLFSYLYKVLGRGVYPLRSLLEVLEYRYWLSKQLPEIKVLANKKHMLDFLIGEMNRKPGKSYVFEFGVAFGETTEYLVKNLSHDYAYHGFDTFTGLPRPWRALPKGAISAGGKIPNLRSKQIQFYKGLVSQTLNQKLLSDIFSQNRKSGGGSTLYIFDFDLYEPTLFAFKSIEPFVKIGDILYFDEVFDRDERLIVENYLLGDSRVKAIQASIFGLAFEIINA